jgi:hypothetical protein
MWGPEVVWKGRRRLFSLAIMVWAEPTFDVIPMLVQVAGTLYTSDHDTKNWERLGRGVSRRQPCWTRCQGPKPFMRHQGKQFSNTWATKVGIDQQNPASALC